MSFVYTAISTGGVVNRRVMKEPFSKDHLLECILSTENVRQAWKQVRSNKGAPGIDGVTVEQFPDSFRKLWPQIRSGDILLDDLDKELERRGHQFVRYAEDFIIMVKSLRAGNRVMASIKRFLERKLRLQVNEKKNKVAPVGECGFLGFVFVRGKIRWSEKSFLEFKWRLRQFTGRSWFVSMEYRYKKMAEYIRGWMNYYGISEYYRPIPGIDEWLRRRIRMCYWKQWRYTRTKVRNLLKLGTFKKEAILTSLSRKGPWHLSRTMATQAGMTNNWLSEQGLISVKEKWVKIHYPATAR